MLFTLLLLKFLLIAVTTVKSILITGYCYCHSYATTIDITILADPSILEYSGSPEYKLLRVTQGLE